MNKIMYIHGWGSSGQGETAKLFQQLIPGIITPTLDYYNPVQSLNYLLSLVDENPADDVYIIASSLGGFFAENVAIRRVVNNILYNPALHPYTVSRIDDSTVQQELCKLKLPSTPTTASTRSVVLCDDDDVIPPEYAAQYFSKYEVLKSTGGHRMTAANAQLIVSLLNRKLNSM